MTPWADIFPDEWVPPRPKEEQAAEDWAEWMDQKQHDA